MSLKEWVPFDLFIGPMDRSVACVGENAKVEVFTFPGLFRMESMWNPWNPSEIPYGIHGMDVG